VILDWLPWNHTFGGNFIFGLNLYHGGSLYIDDGKALPGEVEKTVRNLREIAPTLYFGIPRMVELLLPHLQADAALRRNFFGQLQMIFYAAAALAQPVWDGLRRLSIASTGQRVFTCSTLGSTETGPLALAANWDADRPNILGLPVPGCELKLVANGRKTELRLRGPNITPGYLKQPEQTAQAFDEEGWYCIGDALRFADEGDVDQGLVFDGRIAEDFKLSTGTWVNAGTMRALVASHLSPLARDVLPTGHNRDELGMLVFPEIEVCRRLAGLPAQAGAQEILADTRVRAEFQRRLQAIAAEGTSSVNTVTRLLLLEEALSDVEVTDKGTLSFNLVLERRAGDIAELYGPNASPRALYLRRADPA
jgi:feruloyl-CoA synthase